MRILIAIDAPFDDSAGGREWQYRRTNLGKIVERVASRITLGSNGETFTDGGVVASFKVEQSTPIAKPAPADAA